MPDADEDAVHATTTAGVAITAGGIFVVDQRRWTFIVLCSAGVAVGSQVLVAAGSLSDLSTHVPSGHGCVGCANACDKQALERQSKHQQASVREAETRARKRKEGKIR